MKKTLLMLALIGLVMTCTFAQAEESTVLFNFETGLQGWEIPDWAYEKPDCVQKEINMSDKFANEGRYSLEIDVDFPGGRWTSAVIEIMQFYDWSDYSKIACDLYIPKDAPIGLKGKLILTVGDSWKWVEQSRSFNLEPGKWVTMIGDISAGSIDWRRVQVDDTFRQDIRKIDIRVESNNKPAYTGSIYVDNIRVIK